MKRFFQRRFGCYGLTVPLGRGRQLELWLAPRHAFIPRHVHPHIRSTLIFLGGRMAWWRDELPGKLMTWRHFGRAFEVAPHCAHAAMTFGWFGLFANFEQWLPGVPMTSAATDLELREIGEDNLEGRKAGTEEGKSLCQDDARCSEIARRWLAGESLRHIAAAVGCSRNTVPVVIQELKRQGKLRCSLLP